MSGFRNGVPSVYRRQIHMYLNTGYYVKVRKTNVDARGSKVSDEEDFKFLETVVKKSESETIDDMDTEDLFPYLRKKMHEDKMVPYPLGKLEKDSDGNKFRDKKPYCCLKAFLSVLSIALMNVEDLHGEATTEIQPFLLAVRDTFKHDVTQGIGQMLYMSVLNKVSPKNGKFHECNRNSRTHHRFRTFARNGQKMELKIWIWKRR